MTQHQYSVGEKIVYPAHGVGEVRDIEARTIAGQELHFYVVFFEQDKMTMRIPLKRAEASGVRPLSTVVELDKVRTTLKKRAKVGRGMWSRRAKEYETKINSGDIVSLAEVVRDLHKNVNDPERSYSERVIYENALSRLAGEFSAVSNVDMTKAESIVVSTIADEGEEELNVAA